jgi:NADPH-dependent 2,4-dienoyl-CoA reductase/sulfur reductase-like enzyme
VSRKPVHTPLGDVANKQGYVAGANIGGQDFAFPGVLGSFCCKIFDWELASTGLSEMEAKEQGLDAIAVTIEASSRPDTFSKSRRLWLRLVADKEAGRVLGAQAIGGDGAVSRINLLAAALTAGLSLTEIANLDLAYAPPFSSARDPVHIAAQQLQK